MRKRKNSRLSPTLVPGGEQSSKLREPKREKRVNGMHFKWLWGDSADISRKLWFWSSLEKPHTKLQRSSW